MNASKEEARRALDNLTLVAKALGLRFCEELLIVRNFLIVAERNLPSEAAFVLNASACKKGGTK